MPGPPRPSPLLLRRWVVPALWRVRTGIPGARAGARDSGGGCGCVHEFGRASGAEGRARSPEAWLLRDATVHRLVHPDSRDVGEKRPLSYFPFRKILLAKVFLGSFALCAHTFFLVTLEKGAGRGGFLPAPPRGGATGHGNC